LGEVLAGVPEEFPLDAVFHAAGVIGEGPLDGLSVERFGEELASKVDGALALGELTAGMDLSAFVLFSSIAGSLGSGGQASYSAANAFLSSFAQHRRSLGLVATSVDWGAWAGEGMAAGAGEQLNRRGIREMDPELALVALRQILDRDESGLVVADFDWERYALSYTAARARPLIGDVPEARSALEGRDAVSVGDAREGAFAAKLAGLSGVDREALVLGVVRSRTAAVLGYGSVEDVQPRRAFRDLGLDSLGGVELRNGLQGVLGLVLSATVVFDYPSPVLLARFLVGELVGERGGGVVVGVSGGVVSGELLAVVGMGCRFPGGVVSPGGLWELVCGGVDGVGPFPVDRGWDVGGLFGRGSGGVGVGVGVGVGCVRVGLFMGLGVLMLLSLGSVRGRRWRWILSNGCCWRLCGRRWRTRGSILVF
jgi:Polyketide synthase modules and related proteins